MDMQGALRARLIAASAVNDDVNGHVTWVSRPQGKVLPAITLQGIGEDLAQTHAGFQVTRSPRVQMDVWAPTHKQASDILEAAIEAIAPAATVEGVKFLRTFFEGRRDTSEQAGGQEIYRAGIDMIIWHYPA